MSYALFHHARQIGPARITAHGCDVDAHRLGVYAIYRGNCTTGPLAQYGGQVFVLRQGYTIPELPDVKPCDSPAASAPSPMASGSGHPAAANQGKSEPCRKNVNH